MAQQTLVGLPPHYPGFTLTHTRSVGLPWTCDQPDARGLYPITHIHKKQTSVPPAGFEPVSQQASGRNTMH